MSKINYEQFVKLISNYKEFNKKILLALYDEFGKTMINNMFEQYCNTLEDSEFSSFFNTYNAYFEQKEHDDLIEESKRKKLEEKEMDRKINHSTMGDMMGVMLNSAASFTLMTFEEEKNHGLILKQGKENLKIIKENMKDESLYPRLELEKILLSIRDEEDIELLNTIKKLPFILNDDMIIKNDINIIKKYLKLCKNGIPSIVELQQNFSNLNFDDVEILSKKEYNYQLELLRKYIIAQYNFYNRNLRLVISVAKRYGRKSFTIEDAIQEGNIGLIKAINRFDVEKGYKFSTYAVCWIRQNITRELAIKGEIIRIPVNLTEKINRYQKYANDFLLINGKEPTDEQIKNDLNISEKELLRIKTTDRDLVSLETPIGERENDDLYRFVVNDEEPFEEKIIRQEVVNDLLKKMELKLKPREMTIILERIGYNSEGRALTLDEVGKKMGVTRERVRQLEAKSLTKIRKIANKNIKNI